MLSSLVPVPDDEIPADELIDEIFKLLFRLPEEMLPEVYRQWRVACGLKPRPGTGPLGRQWPVDVPIRPIK